VLETEKKRRQREGQPDAPLSRSCPDSVPENQGQNGDNVPEKTGLEKRREEKSINTLGGAVAPAAGEQSPEPNPSTKPDPISDAEWLAKLATSPAYAGIDVPRDRKSVV